MAFRYKLRTLSPADQPATILQEVWPSSNGTSRLLADQRMPPWERAFQLLHQLGARALLIQKGVRDPDFLEEHQVFYAKQHRPVDRSCVRVHAFAVPVPALLPDEAEEQQIVRFIDEALGAANSYLGFITVRPLRHAPVGATIIKAPNLRETTTADAFPVHIAGNEFEVIGTPFLQQDNAVAACAQASIWMALRALRRRHGNAAFSPAELTVAATRYLAPDRSFPGRQGLTIPQMLEAVRFSGHDPLHLNLRTHTQPPLAAGEVMLRLVPYLESGLPVVLALCPPTGEGHAVVAIGCNYAPKAAHGTLRSLQQNGATIATVPASNWVSALLIHNDNSGPYLGLSSGTAVPGYSLDHLVSIIVALPDRVFTTAAEAELLGMQALFLASTLFTLATTSSPVLPELRLVFRSVLCTRHAFREWAKNDQSLDPVTRQRYRTHDLPKYMWVLEMHDPDLYNPTDPQALSRCGEVVLDASADPFHADGLIFARVIAAMWPSLTLPARGMLLAEDADGLSMSSLTEAAHGGRIEAPWK